MPVGPNSGELFSAAYGYHNLAEQTDLASLQFDLGSYIYVASQKSVSPLQPHIKVFGTMESNSRFTICAKSYPTSVNCVSWSEIQIAA